MAGQQAPTRMERIVAARYGPLVLPVPLDGVTAEEHLEAFYNYSDNLDISENDVWMRVFV